MRYVLNPSGTESKKSSTSGVFIKELIDRELSACADSCPGFEVVAAFRFVADWATLGLFSKLESVSTSWSSVTSNDESAFIAFMAVTGDRLGLGNDISWLPNGVAVSWEDGSVHFCCCEVGSDISPLSWLASAISSSSSI